MARKRSGALALAVASLTLVACGGDSPGEAVDSERRVANLVVGSAAAEWGLLTIPRRGGAADLRPVVHPDSIVWNGATELPVVAGAWALDGASVVLLAEDGTVIRYDLPADEATELAELSDEARVSGASSSSVVFVDSAGRFVYEVGAEHAQGYSLPEPAAWAGPIDGGIAVLVGGETSRLRFVQRADTAGTVEIPDAGRPPALVTAWGRRVVVTGPSGRTVRIYAIEDEDRLIGEAEVDGTVRALGASPSSHEIYVALDEPPTIERLSRFSLETHSLGSLPAAADLIRPGLFGGSLFVRTPEGLARFRIGQDGAAEFVGSWRSDLPLGLAGDLSIALVDDEARLVSVADTGGVVLAGGAPRWWVAVRFNPTAPRDGELREALDDLGTAAGAPDADDGASDGGEAEMPDIDRDEPAAASEGPAGYYAIVTSARQRAGVVSLLESLSEAGYPTSIQSYPDEAGETWHRGLVGPFPSRARAEAAARQLLRERDLQAWVTEIGATE
ncbi:MAG: SPOR domain-containing protein [Gemmatimonadota bacterium]